MHGTCVGGHSGAQRRTSVLTCAYTALLLTPLPSQTSCRLGVHGVRGFGQAGLCSELGKGFATPAPLSPADLLQKPF